MKNKTLWISIAIFVIPAIVFAFADLSISESIANPQSGWAHFMQAYGQLPGMLVGFLGGSILLRLNKLEKSFKSIGLALLFLILTTFTGFGFWSDAFGLQIDKDVNYLLALGLGIALLIIAQVWFHRIPDETMEKYKSFGTIALLLFVLSNLTVWGIKIPWGRWTYRDMLDIGDLSLFTPWYLPQGNNGHHSFVSGHTAMSFCVIPIVLLFKGNKKHTTIALILALTWGTVGAISRVAIGAHFPSDVLFGGGLTLLWFWILSRRHKVTV